MLTIAFGELKGKRFNDIETIQINMTRQLNSIPKSFIKFLQHVLNNNRSAGTSV